MWYSHDVAAWHIKRNLWPYNVHQIQRMPRQIRDFWPILCMLRRHGCQDRFREFVRNIFGADCAFCIVQTRFILSGAKCKTKRIYGPWLILTGPTFFRNIVSLWFMREFLRMELLFLFRFLFPWDEKWKQFVCDKNLPKKEAPFSLFESL